MLHALTLEGVRDFQSKYDPGKGTDQATTFKLKALDSRVHGKVRDSATRVMVDPSRPSDEVETTIEQSEVHFMACSFGLAGWSNFQDARGNDVPFRTKKRNLGGRSYEIVDPDLMRTIPSAVIKELAEEIMKDNELKEIEGKD